MLSIERIYDYASERMDETLISKENQYYISRVINILKKYEIKTNELWFEYHCNGNIDFIMKIWDFEKLYLFYNEQINKNNNKEILNKVCLVLKKIAEGKLPWKNYIKAISLEFDSAELKKDNPIPCIFWEIDYEKIDKEDIEDIYRKIINFLSSSLTKLSTTDVEKALKTIMELKHEGYHLWNVGIMASRNSFLRLVWEPNVYSRNARLAEKLEWNISDNNLYRRYSNVNAEYIIDCDLTGEKFSNFGINIYYKNYEEKLNMLSTLNYHENNGKSFVEALLKWQHKKVLYTKDERGLLIWQICHIKVKQESDLPKIYVRLEHYIV